MQKDRAFKSNFFTKLYGRSGGAAHNTSAPGPLENEKIQIVASATGQQRGRRGLSKAITRLLPLLLLVLFHSGQAGAQQPDQSPIVNLGDAVVTGFSGTITLDAHAAAEQVGHRSHLHQSGRPVGPRHRPWPTGLCLGRPAIPGTQDVRRAGEGCRPGLRRRARRCDPAQHLRRRHLDVRPQHRQPHARRQFRAQEERRPGRRLDEGTVRARPARRPRRASTGSTDAPASRPCSPMSRSTACPTRAPGWAISLMMPRTSNCSCRTSTPA